jgi:hypothetical protein
VTDEELRLSHLAAEQHARDAAVPAARLAPAVPGHSDELLAAHQGRPTVREQKQREVYP